MKEIFHDAELAQYKCISELCVLLAPSGKSTFNARPKYPRVKQKNSTAHIDYVQYILQR